MPAVLHGAPPQRHGQLRDAAARAEALERALFAIARRAERRQTDVPHLARIAIRAAQQPVVQYQPRAQTRAERQKGHAVRALPRAPAPFGQRAGVRVVLEEGGNVEALLGQPHEGHAVPAGQIGRGHHDAQS